MSIARKLVYFEKKKIYTGELISIGKKYAKITRSIDGVKIKINCNRIWNEFDLSAYNDAPLSEMVQRCEEHAATLSLSHLWEKLSDIQHASIDTCAARIFHEGTCGDLDDTEKRLTALIFLMKHNPYFPHEKSADGAGRFSAVGQQTFAAIEKTESDKRRQKEQEEALFDKMTKGEIPTEIVELADVLTQRTAATSSHSAAKGALIRYLGSNQDVDKIEFFIRHKIFTSPIDYHEKLLLSQFNTARLPLESSEKMAAADQLQKSSVSAFTVDDVGTVEIDDAFSVEANGATTRIGVHIALPAIALEMEMIEAMTQYQLISCYFPHAKYTMLTDEVIARYSLAAGAEHPVCSVYITIDTQRAQLLDMEMTFDRVHITANHLPADLINGAASADVLSDFEHLKKNAAILIQQNRELITEKRYTRNYKVHVDDKIRISSREFHQVDEVVEVYMRVLNFYLFSQLAAGGDADGVFGFGRKNAATVTLPATRGASAYGWVSSPLRRSVDLINQLVLFNRHIGNAVRYPDDAWQRRFAEIFDEQRNHAIQAQRSIEILWVLRYLAEQKNDRNYRASRLHKNYVQLEEYPMIRGRCDPKPKTDRCLVRVKNIDLANSRHHIAFTLCGEVES